MQRDFDMPNAAPQLSFGATSVGDLLTAARRAVDPGQAVDWEQLAARVGARVDELIEANQHVVSDAPSEQWLRTCCVVLATYQALNRHVKRGQLLPIFLEAMATPFRNGISSYLESRFGVSNEAPHQAFSQISENFQKRGEERFGSTFRYATDVRDDRRNFVNIERCFFNDFFRANRAPEVTSLFCALDKVWAETLEDHRFGVRFERPTTLANGDDACRFQFSKREIG